MSLGFQFSSRKRNGDLFTIIGDQHELNAWKYPLNDPFFEGWYGDPYAITSTYQFTHGDYQCAYTYDPAPGVATIIGSFPDGDAPWYQVRVRFTNMFRPIVSRELWRYPLSAVTQAVIDMKSTLFEQGPYSTEGGIWVDTYDAAQESPYYPPQTSVKTNIDEALTSSIVLLGVNINDTYNEYQIIGDGGLSIPNDENWHKTDIMDLVGAFYDHGRDCDALCFFPMVNLFGFTLEPQMSVGPEFMAQLMDATYQNSIVGGEYVGEMTYAHYGWVTPMVATSTGQATSTGYAVQPRQRVDYVKIPSNHPTALTL